MNILLSTLGDPLWQIGVVIIVFAAPVLIVAVRTRDIHAKARSYAPGTPQLPRCFSADEWMGRPDPSYECIHSKCRHLSEPLPNSFTSCTDCHDESDADTRTNTVTNAHAEPLHYPGAHDLL